MFGEACFGEVPFGTVLEPVGEPIIPEVVQTTTELVFVVDVIQPQQSG